MGSLSDILKGNKCLYNYGLHESWILMKLTVRTTLKLPTLKLLLNYDPCKPAACYKDTACFSITSLYAV